jgi:type VI secretion system protein ImpE
VTDATLAERSLRAGRPDDALVQLQEQVRKDPANAQYRTFLFQLLCVLGDWERARAQLRTLGELEPGALAMVHVYGAAITCEVLRRDVFAGMRTPLVLGEPLPWLALLLQALSAEARDGARARALRADALEQAPAVPGSIDGHSFEWIADADSRLGPVCEAIIDGTYYWVPFERIDSITLEAASSLRDVVWMPTHIRLANGGEVAALLPARYPGSESDADGLIRMARKTEWLEVAADTFHGRGQRMLATETGVYPLLDVRRVELRGPAA